LVIVDSRSVSANLPASGLDGKLARPRKECQPS
jgi:hypothetical protein